MDGNNFSYKKIKAVNTSKFYKTIQISMLKIEKILNNGYKWFRKIRKCLILLIIIYQEVRISQF